MTEITRLLGDDHKHCDDLFAEAENAVNQRLWDDASRFFADFRAALAHHFLAEETALFPAFEAHTGMDAGPTQVMRAEHTQMTELLKRMADALARRDDTGYLGESETLLMLMRQHNLKEEQILYPLCDRTLGGDAGLVAAIEHALRGN